MGNRCINSNDNDEDEYEDELRIRFISESNLNYCERIDLWCFHHSTPTGKLSYGGYTENIYCSCLNCCPGNLELKYNKYGCKKDKVCLIGCCALYFI